MRPVSVHASLIEPEDLGLVKSLEVQRVNVAQPIRLAGCAQSERLTGVLNSQEQWQREVVSEDPALVNLVELAGVDVERVLSDSLAGLFEIEDLVELDLREVLPGSLHELEHFPDRILGQVR
jgi:hypothetical protein